MDPKVLRVLVVEDEDDIAHFTCKILEREGFCAFKALDGKTALDIFEKEHPHILMLDLDLGYSDIKGVSVLEKIRQNNHEIECIVITRVTDPEVKNQVTQLGITDYLNKPLYPDDWLPKVRQAAQSIRERGLD